MTVERGIELLLGSGGAIFALVLFVWAGWKRIIVWGWYATEKAEEAKEWKRLALSGTALAEQAIKLRQHEKAEGGDGGG